MATELPKKAIKKANMDLIDLHKRILLHYFATRDLSYKGRKKFYVIYDHYINYKNIRNYFHIPIKVFVIALIQDRLDEVRSFEKSKDYRKNKKTLPKKKKYNIRYV